MWFSPLGNIDHSDRLVFDNSVVKGTRIKGPRSVHDTAKLVDALTHPTDFWGHATPKLGPYNSCIIPTRVYLS